MKNIKQIHQKLDEQCPSDYRINEIIYFAYPYRRLRIAATVNKMPEESIRQIYSVLLRSIAIGYRKEEEIRAFLGLQRDDFLLRELYFLRERGYLNLISSEWHITEHGNAFIKDNSVLKILENEEFEFLIDAINEEVLPKEKKLFSEIKDTKKRFEPKVNYRSKDAKILDGKYEQLAVVYKRTNRTENAHLVSYDKEDILFDKLEYQDYYLIEYIGNEKNEQKLSAFIEIRNNDADFSKNKRLTKLLSKVYPDIVYEFTDSERGNLARLLEEKPSLRHEFKQEKTVSYNKKSTFETLAIWETKAKFEKALTTAKHKILIESPWIKRATKQYIPLIKKALERKVKVVILYGIANNDEHHDSTMKSLENLESRNTNFYLIHLPSHLAKKRGKKMVGTHRKLVIKDEEYYISGSFNFLSFNKREGQIVANEESTLIRENVVEKWKSVFAEYDIKINW